MLFYSSANAQETLGILSSVTDPHTHYAIENSESNEAKAEGETPESRVTQATDCSCYESQTYECHYSTFSTSLISASDQ
jgi:hypothetical protein